MTSTGGPRVVKKTEGENVGKDIGVVIHGSFELDDDFRFNV
jgi:hypothetical protein